MKNKRKAKKKHICDTCSVTIKQGETYELTELRIPRYLEDGKTQIGVEYLKFKSCPSCIEQTETEIEEWEAFRNTKEYKYEQSMWEHKYP